MAIRFFDTGFFKSPFVRGLKAPLKTLYCFIICDCQGSGIWVKDLEVASVYIGTKVTDEDFQVFIDQKKAIDLGDGRFFFPDFIEHQYPKGLSSSNPATKNFVAELKKYGLINSDLKVLSRPFQGSQEQEQDKEPVKEQEKTKEYGEKKDKFMTSVEILSPHSIIYDLDLYFLSHHEMWWETFQMNWRDINITKEMREFLKFNALEQFNDGKHLKNSFKKWIEKASNRKGSKETKKTFDPSKA